MLDINEKFKVLNLQSSTTITVDTNSAPVLIEEFDERFQAIFSLGAVVGAGSLVINVQSSTTSAGTYTTRASAISLTSGSANTIASFPVILPATDTHMRVFFDVTGTLSTVVSAEILAPTSLGRAGLNSRTFA